MQQNLNPGLSDSSKRKGWAGQTPEPRAVVSSSSLFSFPGAGLLGAFGPGESMGRRTSRGGAGHAGAQPWDQTAGGGAREKVRWLQRGRLPHRHPPKPLLSSWLVPIFSPSPVWSGKAQACLLPYWSSGNRPGLREAPDRAGEKQGLWCWEVNSGTPRPSLTSTPHLPGR